MSSSSFAGRSDPKDQLIQFCLSPPEISSLDQEEAALKRFERLCFETCSEVPEARGALQMLGWPPAPAPGGLPLGQSVSHAALTALAQRLMGLVAPPPVGMERLRSMPTDVSLSGAGRMSSQSQSMMSVSSSSFLSAPGTQASFVSDHERRLQARKLQESQVAVRKVLNMPTEEDAIQRKARNTEAKIYVEAMEHAQGDNDRKLYYQGRLNDIYAKMSQLIKAHRNGTVSHSGGLAKQLSGLGRLDSQNSIAGAVQAQARSQAHSHSQAHSQAQAHAEAMARQGSFGGAFALHSVKSDESLAVAAASTSSRGSYYVGSSGGGDKLLDHTAQQLPAAARRDIHAPTPQTQPRGGVDSEYWRKLDKLRPHRGFAMRYIATLDKFLERTKEKIASTINQAEQEQLKKKRKVADNVRKYLFMLCKLCSEKEGATPKSKHSMRLLEVIQKTLDAVYKRHNEPDAAMNNRKMAVNHRVSNTKHENYTAGRSLANPRPNALRLGYDDTALGWNDDHTANKEHKYCYCGTNKQEACLQCSVCKNWFHKNCTQVIPKNGKGWVDFMINYRFTCKICNVSDNQERFETNKCSWLESILGGFNNLMYVTGRDMFKAAEITNHLDKHWDALCHKRDRGDNKKWRNSLNSYLTNNIKKFERPKKFFWALANPDKDPLGPIVQPCRLLQRPALPPPADIKPNNYSNKKPSNSSRKKQQQQAPQRRQQRVQVPLNHMQPPPLFPYQQQHPPFPYPNGMPQHPFGGPTPGLGAPPPPGPPGPPGGLPMMTPPPFGRQQSFEVNPFPSFLEMNPGVADTPWHTNGPALGTGPEFQDHMATWEDQPWPMNDSLESTTSLGDMQLWGDGLDGKDFVEQAVAEAVADDDQQCAVCSEVVRFFGNDKRNSQICIKCDHDQQQLPKPDLQKAKIPKDRPVWQAKVHIGSDPIAYTVCLCEPCKVAVDKNGDVPWTCVDTLGKTHETKVAATKFEQQVDVHPEECWVQCDFCEKWYHEICVKFDKQIYGEQQPMLCPNSECQRKREEKWGRMEDVAQSAEDLRVSKLSKFLEQRLDEHVFAGTDRADNHGVTVRVITNVPRSVKCSQKVDTRYQRQSVELPYMQKHILAFYRCPDGSEIAFFSLLVQEYGADCPEPNRNKAYISYLDSNQLYHCPGCAAHQDQVGADYWTRAMSLPQCGCSMPAECKQERRKIYDNLFIGYLDYLRQRGLHRAYIWVMPPETAEQDYVFFYRPDDMHIPTAKQLETWYIRVLEEAVKQGAVADFEDNTGRRAENKKQRRSTRRSTDFLFKTARSPADGGGDKRSVDEIRTENQGGDEQPASKKPKVTKGDGVAGTNVTAGANHDSDQALAAGAANDAQMGNPPSVKVERESGESLRHMPIFKNDYMARVMEDVIERSEQKEKSVTGSRKSKNSTRVEEEANAARDSMAASSSIGRSMSTKLVEAVAKEMQDERVGSYIVCHFEAESNKHFVPSIDDDSAQSVDDKPLERTLDERENLIRLCADKHYQFNTMRCAKFSTMLLLHYFLQPNQMKDITAQNIVRSISVRDNRSVERAISRRVASQHEAAGSATESSSAAADAASLAMANDAMTEKYRARIQQRKQQSAGVDKPTFAFPALPSESSGAKVQSNAKEPQAVLRSQSVTGVLPRSKSLSDFDGRLVDELREPLRTAKRLDAIRAFVTEQQQLGVATQARVSRLIQKLTELLGVESVTRAASAVLGGSAQEAEQMLLRTLKDRLKPEELNALEDFMAKSDGQPTTEKSTMEIIRFLGGSSGQEVVTHSLCAVVEVLMKQVV